ncbi:MAG: hypothetical protein KatS3mg119_1124 [Rhodothalassiaceae bacterium]|nr:MAG: hypothetical protein KatS3mg119_1124 [Rhodothalassiaceae bacterium]
MLSFAHPAVLAGLAALPAIWWLLTHLPPQPRRIFYPPAAILADVDVAAAEARRPPLWLVILRLVIATLLILAAAGPAWQRRDAPLAGMGEEGAVLLVVDNGLPTAENWQERMEGLGRLLRALPAGARIALLATAPGPGAPIDVAPALRQTMDPGAAAEASRRLHPQPFFSDFAGLARRIEALAAAPDRPAFARIVWLSDGFQRPGRQAFAAALARLAPVEELRAPQPVGPFLLRQAELAGEGYRVTVVRPAGQPAATITAELRRADGQVLASAALAFAAGAPVAAVTIRPQGLSGSRAFAIRLIVPAGAGAGHLRLLGRTERWRRIAVVAGPRESARPFAAPSYYLARALADRGEITVGPLDRLLAGAPDVVILADRPVLPDADREALARFVKEGGLLLRFAGPHYENRHDDLHPEALARGARLVGGELSWERPQPIAPIAADSPLFPLELPADVSVSGQVLALPGETGAAVWARLADGTPLVTARRLGKGELVFVHTSADPAWSTLALSPAFPRFLDALLAAASLPPHSASGVRSDDGTRLEPRLVLTGTGRLAPAPPAVEALAADELLTRPLAPGAPAGVYAGPGGGDQVRPLQGVPGGIAPDFVFAEAPGGFQPLSEAAGARRALWPGLLLLALVLLMVEAAALARPGRGSPAGLLRRLRGPAGAGAALLIAVLAAGAGAARAAERAPDPARVIAAISEPRLAFVANGDPVHDGRLKAGLAGLTRVLRLRTAAALGEPMAVRLDGDLPLALFPLVYWAPAPGRPPLSPREEAALARYVEAGGILLIDLAAGGGGRADLARVLPAASFLPPLVALDSQHILARSFYLLDWFPGRRDGDVVWVSADSLGDNPRVSPVVIGAHDWAGAWAVGADGRFLVPELAGGIEQREFAFRFGVNLVIYALAGTYKGDQIHLPAILERLKRREPPG